MSVAVVQCKCPNEFQDRRYGKQARVANDTQKPAPQGRKKVRCSVCSSEHEVSDAQLKK